MGLFGTILGFWGFGIGVLLGLVIGYFLFIHLLPTDVQDPEIQPLEDQETEALQRLIPEIPLWVKNPDYDRIDWLNTFCDICGHTLTRTVEETAKPIIAQQTPQYKIDSVEFEKLTLGTLPPTFQGMKVYATEDKELIMEPSLKWAGNPNITVAVKAFGLKATAQLVDLQVFAIPRITLKPLVPSFPCFANIYVSLMEKPHVDFGLKLIGADLMSIPGLYRFVQDLIKDQVANMYLWPKTLEVPIMDAEKALKRPVGILLVKVLRAMKLKKKDLIGSSDPYVKMKLTEDNLPSKKTTVKHKNLNPEWNEEFSLVVKDPATQELEFFVYDWEKVGKHDKMGFNAVPLKDLVPEETQEMTLDLFKDRDRSSQNDKTYGQIVMELTYKPFREEDLSRSFKKMESIQRVPEGTPASGGLLIVIIHEAQDLEGKYHNNPHVRVTFKGDERKTKTMKRTREPRWDEEIQFTLQEPPTNEKMHVEVVSTASRNLLHPKESLGYIDIILTDVVNNKRINETYNLIDSKNGQIQIELQWRTA